jgi:hypothetical protein
LYVENELGYSSSSTYKQHAPTLQQEESQAMSLMQLQARSGMPLVAMWLGVLLGGYGLEQRGEFYQRETIWVEGRRE